MKKTIFIDIDGTLADNNRNISKKNIEAINKTNNDIVLCTGRPRDYVLKHTKKLKNIKAIISNNGSEIYEINTNKVLYENVIKKEALKTLYRSVDLRTSFMVTSDGLGLIINNIEELNRKIIQTTIFTKNFELLKTIKNELILEDIYIANQHRALVDENYKKEGTFYIDIVSKDSSKGNAIKEYMKIYNVKKEDTYCIGDGINDISMFETCGYRVAMKNAHKSIIELADLITDDNNHDGVAKFINTI